MTVNCNIFTKNDTVWYNRRGDYNWNETNLWKLRTASML